MRIVMCLAALWVSEARAEVVELRSDPWCPYVCDDPDAPGFMVEIAAQAFALHGVEVNVDFLPWSRALREAEQSRIHGVIAAVPSEAPTLLFSEPMSAYVDALAYRAGEAASVTQADDLSGLRLGVIYDYEYYGAVNDYIDLHLEDRTLVQFAVGQEPLEMNLRKLLAGRLDVVAETESVLLHKLAQMGVRDEVEVFVLEGGGHVHIAFAPDDPDARRYLEMLDTGVAQLRRDGRVAEIMSRYGQ